MAKKRAYDMTIIHRWLKKPRMRTGRQRPCSDVRSRSSVQVGGWSEAVRQVHPCCGILSHVQRRRLRPRLTLSDRRRTEDTERRRRRRVPQGLCALRPLPLHACRGNGSR